MRRNPINPGLTGLATYLALIWLQKNATPFQLCVGFVWLVLIAFFEWQEMREQKRRADGLVEALERDYADMKSNLAESN